MRSSQDGTATRSQRVREADLDQANKSASSASSLQGLEGVKSCKKQIFWVNFDGWVLVGFVI